MMVKVTSYFTFAGDMYRRYIPQEDYFSEGLYMFDIGQNDLAGEFYSKNRGSGHCIHSNNFVGI